MSDSPLAPLIVVSGPSGSGKSTLIGTLVEEGTWPLRHAVSVTTRAQRPRETPGVSYHYWTKDEFLDEVRRDGFLEWAEVFGNYYGTLEREVTPFRQKGTGVIMDIDVQGWAQVRRRCPDAYSIFVNTSSLDALETRLKQRRTESPEALQRRLEVAKQEIARAGEYQTIIVNDDLKSALEQLRAVVRPLFERNHHA